jgi:hypothetical protein
VASCVDANETIDTDDIDSEKQNAISKIFGVHHSQRHVIRQSGAPGLTCDSEQIAHEMTTMWRATASGRGTTAVQEPLNHPKSIKTKTKTILMAIASNICLGWPQTPREKTWGKSDGTASDNERVNDGSASASAYTLIVMIGA